MNTIQSKTIYFQCYFLFLTVIIAFSCQLEIAPYEKNDIPDYAVLMFKEMPPQNYFFEKSDGGKIKFMESDVTYFEIPGIENAFVSQYAPHSDTLRVKTSNPFLEVKHAVKSGEQYTYFISRGDSVLFSYKNSRPEAHSLRYTNDFALNLDRIIQDSVYFGGPTILKRIIPFFDDEYFLSFSSGNPAEYLTQKYLTLYEELDSLRASVDQFLNRKYKEKNISQEIFEIYRKKTMYDCEIAKIEIKRFLRNTKQDDGFIKIQLLENDSLAKFSFYQNYLYTYLPFAFDNILLRERNPIALFDSVIVSTHFSSESKKIILFTLLKSIIQSSSKSDIQTYFEKFKKEDFDSIYATHLKIKYNLKFNFDNTEHLLLLDQQGNEMAFENIIQNNAKKILYIDFWASWCAPCRRAMPASKALREEFKGRDVSFLYFSIDDEEIMWRRANDEEGLSMRESSFLVKNRYTSQLLEDLKVNTIPRYLLYDKQGKLVHSNAPGPEGEAIRRLLNEYLTK